MGEIVKGRVGQDMEGLKFVLELLLNGTMKMEREQLLGIGSYERTENRNG